MPFVALCAALFTFSACDDGDCTDGDKDGYGIGGGCKAADCDDGNALHHADCGACSDPDRDGRGVGCDLGPDCATTSEFHWADCGKCTDADLDGHGKGCDLGDDCDDNDPDQAANCKGCVDGDADGFYTGCDQYVNRPGPDCNDADPNNYIRCGFCKDADGDGYSIGCDRYSGAIMGPDCDDADANNWAACGVCADHDGDGYYTGCDKYSGNIKGPDCDDASFYHHADCGVCVDTDNDGRGPGCDLGSDCDSNTNRDTFANCASCVDGDSDGWYAGCDTYFQHTGPDCNDSDYDLRTAASCMNCKDLDGDGRYRNCDSYVNHLGPDCNDGNPNAYSSYACAYCADNDGDGHYANCDAYANVAGPDCNDYNKNTWATCGTCADIDGDTYWAGCDQYVGVNGPDCAVNDNRHWNDCGSCTDTDNDGRGPGCNLGADCNVTSVYHWDDCTTCTDGDGDGYGAAGSTACNIGLGDCNDADAARNPGAADTTLDGTDQNCDNVDGPAFIDSFEDGVFGPEFTAASGDTHIANTSTSFEYARTGTRSLNVGGGTGYAQSRLFDTSVCTNGVAFRYWVKRGYDPPETNDTLIFEWSINGSTWNTADTTTGTNSTDSGFLPHQGLIGSGAGANSSTFRFRFRTPTGNGYGTDDFFVDDLMVVCQGVDTDTDGVTDPVDCAPNNVNHWNDCGFCTDNDNDGFGTAGTCDKGLGDCDDTDNQRWPGNSDLTVDGKDENCNFVDGITTSTQSTFTFLPVTISDSGFSAATCGASGAAVASATVTTYNGTLTDVDINVSITHPLDSDIDMWVRFVPTVGSPVCIELSTDNGAGASYTSTTFSDQAATAVTAGTSPFTGLFQPEGLLSGLNGMTKNGTYTLYVNDDTVTNTGSITAFSVTYTYW